MEEATGPGCPGVSAPMHDICSKLLYAAIIAGLIAAFAAPGGSAQPVRQIASAAVIAR